MSTKLRRTISIVVGSICLVTIFFCWILSSLYYAGEDWDGSGESGAMVDGVIMLDMDTPLVVEEQRLIFDIQEFPGLGFDSEEEWHAYEEHVTTEYVFHNPTEEDITVRMMQPVGWAYGYGTLYDMEIQQRVPFASMEKYHMYVDGAEVEPEFSETYTGNEVTFEKVVDWEEPFEYFLTYALTVGAGESVSYSVEAPLFPDVEMGIKDYTFSYQYCFAHTKMWSELDQWDIIVKTQFPLANDCESMTNEMAFEETKEGFKTTVKASEDDIEFVLEDTSYETDGLTEEERTKRGYFLTGCICGTIIVVLVVAEVVYRIRKRRDQ